jgi:transcriptional regulator with XRE-family HTH domain
MEAGVWNGSARNLLQEGTSTRDFGTIIRARRKERGLTQKQLASQIMVEGRPISQSNLADLERGFAPARPHLIEEFARVLEINRDLLYLAADIVPPEVAEELRRLTPEEREMAWGAFKKVVAEARAEKMRQQERVNARPASATAKVKKNKKAS